MKILNNKMEMFVLWVLIIITLSLCIFNILEIGNNHRRIDLLKDNQSWLFEHPDNYWPVINTIIETQGVILELLDELIEPEKKNYTLY